MNRKFFVTAFFSIFLAVSSAQASIMSAFDIRVTVDVPENGQVDTYALALGIDNFGRLTPLYDINTLTKIQGETSTSLMLTKLINMMQRTYTPDPYPSQDEEWAMYKSNQLYGLISLSGAFNSPSSSRWFVSLPDFSGYNIINLYADNFTSINGTSVELDTRILADVEPVPEPSTFILVAVGVALFAFFGRRRSWSKVS